MKENRKILHSYKYNEHIPSHQAEYVESRLHYIRPYLTNVGKILELGCGEGLLSERIKRESACEFYGLDISPSGVRLAKKRGIIAQVADLNEDLPYLDNSFDMILSDQVLEHVFRTDHLFDEIYRILKPKGTVILITPNLSFWLNRALFPLGYYPIFSEASERSKMYGTKVLKRLIKDNSAVGHIRVFNQAALEDIFSAHNLQIKKMQGLPMSWGLPSTLRIFYDLIDRFFSLFPSLSRDVLVVAVKETG
ncbi:hypothetical protein A2Z00_02430 [Candidatus Gottesmanbacteria bacterium RBG_13_45_10]|uniref:Uncharacterized protein n=1 Tax=Candidatus Gottesmanbacteria bacterium RBG_13_45_10 TaxID=1798370 RepID=A0A1F5ZFU8_9BACT|nr:MAG: hypothetical protein A2Z00_02430 [Candidatus Gottesmanbacteria bacterium RBG_13_45_10]